MIVGGGWFCNSLVLLLEFGREVHVGFHLDSSSMFFLEEKNILRLWACDPEQG